MWEEKLRTYDDLVAKYNAARYLDESFDYVMSLEPK